MVEPVGRKLQQARLHKQVSVEEAARVTRMRPDKIMDLEEDNYANFPSMSYAKGFLLIYAKFLGVDVSAFADTLHAPNPVSTADYQYLNAAASLPAPAPSRSYSSFAARRKPSILPVLVIAVLVVIAFLVVYVMSITRRLGNLDDVSDHGTPASSASPAITTLPPATPVPVATPMPIAPAATPRPAAPVAAAPSPLPSPSIAFAVSPPMPTTFDPALEVRRAMPVTAGASPAASASPARSATSALTGTASSLSAIAPAAMKEISVQPLRKTRVTIRRDVADSAPVFEDWLYPNDGPLKVRGRKFWIKVQDPGSVQVTEDGKPVAPGQDEVRIE